MSRELLLARRLLEAVADPGADRQSAEDASTELAQVFSRINVSPGHGLPVANFEIMDADDLSPHAWLLLLESRRSEDAKIPVNILSKLFLNNADPVIRFRLVSGSLHQDGSAKPLDWFTREGIESFLLEDLPRSWARDFLLALPNLDGSDIAPPEQVLAEFTLYLLQDGSPTALALAAAAITPDQPWRGQARQTLGRIVRAVDPNMTDIGRYFRRAGI